MLIAGCSSTDQDTPQPQTSTETREAAIDIPTSPVSIFIEGDGGAPVDAVETDASGVLHPPTDVSRIGWWVDSALPGTPGTVVVSGHINLNGVAGYGGKFIDLHPGDKVELKTEDGDIEAYSVTEVVNYDKADEFPMDRLNALEGPEELALITCGGEFIGPPFGYEDNVIAWATPIEE